MAYSPLGSSPLLLERIGFRVCVGVCLCVPGKGWLGQAATRRPLRYLPPSYQLLPCGERSKPAPGEGGEARVGASCLACPQSCSVAGQAQEITTTCFRLSLPLASRWPTEDVRPSHHGPAAVAGPGETDQGPLTKAIPAAQLKAVPSLGSSWNSSALNRKRPERKNGSEW